MKKFLKIIFKSLLVFIIVAFILIFLMFSAMSEVVPDVYVTSESGKGALAIRGSHKWNSFSESIVVDDISVSDYVYTNENIILVTPGEKITFNNSNNPLNRYKFYQLEMKYYDEYNKEFIVPSPEDSTNFADLNYLELNVPEDEGVYIYNFKLSYYNKGEVEYGLKVIVSTEPNYDIENLVNYRNTTVIDVDKINEILDLLPYSKYKSGVAIRYGKDSRELVVNCEELVMTRDELMNNIIALFTLIPDLNLITYASELENLTFTRYEIENQVGRSLVDYSNDFELWKKEILFKEKVLDKNVSKDMIYKAIIDDVVSELNSEEFQGVAIDIESLKNDNVLPVSDVDGREIIDYVLNFSQIVYDIDYDKYKSLNSNYLFIGLVEIKSNSAIKNEDMSGDIINSIDDSDAKELVNNYHEEETVSVMSNIGYNSGNSDILFNIDLSGERFSNAEYEDKYICTMIISKNKNSRLVYYEIEYDHEKWNITKIQEQ